MQNMRGLLQVLTCRVRCVKFNASNNLQKYLGEIMTTVDRSRMNVQEKGFRFKPMRPTDRNEQKLADVGLSGNVELIAFERGGERRVLKLTDMIYHHVCQGELAGEPYLITF